MSCEYPTANDKSNPLGVLRIILRGFIFNHISGCKSNKLKFLFIEAPNKTEVLFL